MLLSAFACCCFQFFFVVEFFDIGCCNFLHYLYNYNNLLHEFTPCQRTQRWSLSLEFALYAALWSELNQCWQFADLPIRLDEMIISFWRIVINIMTPAAAPSDTDYDLVT